jgi:hypothetical protein
MTIDESIAARLFALLKGRNTNHDCTTEAASHFAGLSKAERPLDGDSTDRRRHGLSGRVVRILKSSTPHPHQKLYDSAGNGRNGDSESILFSFDSSLC